MTQSTDPEAPEAFRWRLRWFRQRHLLTQQDLAAAMGVRTATIVDLEKGREQPWPRTVERFRQVQAKLERVKEAEMDALEGMS